MKFLLRIYDPALDWALRHRKTVHRAAAMLILASALLIAFGLPRAVREATARRWLGRGPQMLIAGFGKEFMPPLNEGSLLFMPVLMPKTGLKEIQRVMSWQDSVIAETPEVASVAGKLGRFETATDPAPTEMLETTIMLKPEYIPSGGSP